MRVFETGATRNLDSGKLDYEGFISPLVIHRFAQYMHKHRYQADGQLRDSDNWQKGMPLDVYMKSGYRHFMDWWFHHREVSRLAAEDVEEALCALLFNVQGYLHESLKEKAGGTPGEPITAEQLNTAAAAWTHVPADVRTESICFVGGLCDYEYNRVRCCRDAGHEGDHWPNGAKA